MVGPGTSELSKVAEELALSMAGPYLDGNVLGYDAVGFLKVN